MEPIYFSFVVLLALAPSVSLKPIMVSFGTNPGPIIPPTVTPTHIPDARYLKPPAPVSEKMDDLPNPIIYKPLVPQQYRNKLFSFKPNPNLILGSLQDQKYLAHSEKYSLLKRQQARAVGFDYRGPQFFEVQPYELEKYRREPRPQDLFQPIMQPYEPTRIDLQNSFVPEIGVVYSSGVRYYIPQFGHFEELHENSVYDKNDVKYGYETNKI